MATGVDDRSSLLWMSRGKLAFWAVVFVGAFLGLAFWWAPADWHPVRTALFGLTGGAFAYLSVFVNRIIIS